MTETLAWHFVGDTLRDGRPVPDDGVVLRQRGKIIPCVNGLHGSVRAIDALQYAPRPIICRTSHGGTIVTVSDKLASSTRTVLWRVNGTGILSLFARQCALDVAHLWDMPPIVREYLEAGDEALRAAARDAAWAAARDAAWDAARAAAWAAAPAWAAWDAARDAARDAAWAAPRDAAPREAAWDAARDAQNTRLEALINQAHEADK
jgi:hypothetical protein